jgi:hypothetical protein
LFQIAQLRRRCQFVPAVEARFPNGIVIKGALYSIDNSIEFYETRGNADVILDEFREIGRLLIDMNFKVVSNTADEADVGRVVGSGLGCNEAGINPCDGDHRRGRRLMRPDEDQSAWLFDEPG